MEPAVDFVVMNLHVRVPAIDELRETREREPLHAHFRGPAAAVPFRGDLDHDVVHTHAVLGRIPRELRAVGPPLVLPGKLLGGNGIGVARPLGEQFVEHFVLARFDWRDLGFPEACEVRQWRRHGSNELPFAQRRHEFEAQRLFVRLRQLVRPSRLAESRRLLRLWLLRLWLLRLWLLRLWLLRHRRLLR